MKYRNIFLLTIGLLLSLTVHAQKLTVESMTVASNDISASQYVRKDLNNRACALVKVLLPMPGAVFEGNVIGSVDFKTGEYWVYMTEGSKELRIKHPKAQPVQAVFKDYGVDKLTSKTTYMLSVLLSQAGGVVHTQKLIINYSPANAMVLIDSQPHQGNGHIELTLPIGTHNYQVVAIGYETAEGSVKLTASSPRTITENLNRTANQQVAANNVQQQTAVQQPAQQYAQQQSSVSQTSSSSANNNLSVRDFSFEEGDLFDKKNKLTEKGRISLGQVVLVLQENPQTRVSVRIGLPEVKGSGANSAYKRAYNKARYGNSRFDMIRDFLIGHDISKDRILKDSDYDSGIDARLRIE